MQQLQFEASWDKTLSAEDRQIIEKLFQETKHSSNTEILFSRIREAINHREELLITVLVHNFSDSTLEFSNQQLVYNVSGKVIGDALFTLPALKIPPKVSMPWTFIFPKESYTRHDSYENGQLEIL